MSAIRSYVLLEDGSRFEGQACGAEGHAVGEVVFTTGMSGYQESVTDPSYAAQLITFTYPHIGNYGVSAQAMESSRIWSRAVVMREACNSDQSPGAEGGWLRWLRDCGVPAITGVDTRALVRHIRQQGSMRGGIFPETMPDARAADLIAEEPPMNGRDLARQAGTQRVEQVGEGDGPLIALIDTGVKSSIVANLLERGARVRLHPCTHEPAQILAGSPSAVLLGNGPGDPAALDYLVGTVRDLLGHTPVWGICLGHQILCRALGLQTFKLPFGHRGANHPVKDLRSGRVEITSQNHGFAVLGPRGQRLIEDDEAVRWDTDYGAAALTHVNLYDRTVEGLQLLEVPGGSVQYHPEASPGPHDSAHFFDRVMQSLTPSSGPGDRPGTHGTPSAPPMSSQPRAGAR